MKTFRIHYLASSSSTEDHVLIEADSAAEARAAFLASRADLAESAILRCVFVPG